MSEPTHLEETSSPALAAVLRSAQADAPRDQERELRRLSAAAGVVIATRSGAAASSSLWLRRAGWLVLGTTLIVVGGGMWSSRTRLAGDAASTVLARPAPSAHIEDVAPAPLPAPTTVVSVDDLPAVRAKPSVAPRASASSASRATIVHPSEPTSAELPDELSMIDAVRSALSAGQPSLALERLAAYRRTYPRASFDVEGDVLEVQALAALGQTASARNKAQAFLLAHAGSPYEARVRAAANLPTTRNDAR
ncbi:hypothetical protein AKJ09_09358 [Labilithrix luteola]|uniref:Uncharacterized protein n=1 Tax=Labilithrix luteola TaxID=1391654 RepID=A0A0K1QBB1_9BACT|nr:hypothetical protein [Labilithrix luteola]AKV02695.1 hypothetical protein AKJ09_09358 [Labilithrix luteola]